MLKFLYAIRDNKAESLVGSMYPIYAHDAPAIRMFTDQAANPDTMVNHHLEDFDLVRLGTVDEGSGELCAGFVVVLTGAALKAAQVASSSGGNDA